MNPGDPTGVDSHKPAIEMPESAIFPKENEMDLSHVRVAVLVEQQYQEMEVWYPVYRLREAGCKVTLVGPEAGQTYLSKLGYPAKSDKAAKDCSADDFDLLVIPGGFAPDYIRRSEPMIRLVSG